jgi:hypothetical protein
VPLNKDYRDLFAALNEAAARYLLVGGYAIAYHGRPRFTQDLDVWVEATPENAERVHRALLSFGAPADRFSASDFAAPRFVVQLGVAPNRISILTTISGLEFGEAWPSRAVTEYGDQAVPVIGREELIRNKRASGRTQDLADVEMLEAFREPRTPP